MIDIVEVTTDAVMVDTQTAKATNLMSVQVGSLEYAPTFGIDLKYFLQDGIKFQNDSFQAYLVEALANKGINVASLVTQINALFEEYNFNLAQEETSTSLVAR